jgi:glyoxylase-like metal-dependent hydrolase (beta-lactamase superfamily II)/rhodanese-related sulfurtransferase
MAEIEAGGLLSMLGAGEVVSVIDVRSPEEYDQWAIPGAVNLPLDTLEDRLGEVPDEGLVVLVCALGERASKAQEILSAHGIASSVLAGGMSAWGRTYDEVALVTDDVTVVQIRRRGKGCLSYVIGASERCVVIDPSTDLERPIAVAQARGWRITHVADTHLHADHVSGARMLAEATGATLVVSDQDAYCFEVDPLPADASIPLGPGRSLGVEVVATPGHTTGSIMLVLDDLALFTGDTLFVEGVGRPDLADRAEEFAAELYHSIHERILSRPDSMLVLPAHFGARVDVREGELVGATLGELRASLEALRLPEDEFVTWASTEVTERPANYVEIMAANRGLIHLSSEEIAQLELGPNRCAVAAPPD